MKFWAWLRNAPSWKKKENKGRRKKLKRDKTNSEKCWSFSIWIMHVWRAITLFFLPVEQLEFFIIKNNQRYVHLDILSWIDTLWHCIFQEMLTFIITDKKNKFYFLVLALKTQDSRSTVRVSEKIKDGEGPCCDA